MKADNPKLLGTMTGVFVPTLLTILGRAHYFLFREDSVHFIRRVEHGYWYGEAVNKDSPMAPASKRSRAAFVSATPFSGRKHVWACTILQTGLGLAPGAGFKPFALEANSFQQAFCESVPCFSSRSLRSSWFPLKKQTAKTKKNSVATLRALAAIFAAHANIYGPFVKLGQSGPRRNSMVGFFEV